MLGEGDRLGAEAADLEAQIDVAREGVDARAAPAAPRTSGSGRHSAARGPPEMCISSASLRLESLAAALASRSASAAKRGALGSSGGSARL